MRRFAFFLVNVVLPIAIGAGIYLGWRSTDLMVFRWIEAVDVSGFVVRPMLNLPSWVLYCLPDGCWAYAYTSWMLAIWGRLNLWVCSGVVLAVGCEFGQLVRFVPGTYDTLDVVFYLVAFVLAGVVHAKTHRFGHRGGSDGNTRGR
jgi:hypothetical protein